MKEEFTRKNFSDKSLELISTINDILEEYEGQGYRLSLRQLYYQLVARDYIENSVLSYKRIGTIVSDARLAGEIDWAMIEDRGRESIMPTHWESPSEIVRAAAQGFRVDMWEDQSNYVEVMVEKDALSGILSPVCNGLDVRFTANKGYSSSSALYEAGKRIEDACDIGKDVYILYFGDHDPSGIDMTRDIRERLSLFSKTVVEVERLALNMNQVREWNPPKNPAKETDSRFAAYLQEFGESSWELDAVEPVTLASLVRTHINQLIDVPQWEKTRAKEKAMQDELLRFANNYGKNGRKSK
jgi:hypothetical protein